MSALTSDATFDVVIDGVTNSIDVPDTVTSLAEAVTEVNSDLAALGVDGQVEAVVEDGRLALAAVDDAVQSLSFENVNDIAAAVFGFANEQSGIPFFDS